MMMIKYMVMRLSIAIVQALSLVQPKRFIILHARINRPLVVFMNSIKLRVPKRLSLIVRLQDHMFNWGSYRQEVVFLWLKNLLRLCPFKVK